MNIRHLLSLLIVLTLSANAHADRYESLFPPARSAGDQTLERKGVSKLVVGYIFNVYVAALYQLPESGPRDALADQPRHLEIEYLRDLSKPSFLEAAEDMLAKQHDRATIESIRPGIEAINKLYQDVKKGDRYALTYVPGIGTELFFNGESKGIVPGADFARIYFTIWLGENHPYQSFRDRLVGLK